VDDYAAVLLVPLERVTALSHSGTHGHTHRSLGRRDPDATLSDIRQPWKADDRR
jgi:hypothetical protein